MKRMVTVQELELLAAKARYNVKGLAAALNISTRQLQREIHDRFGVSPQAWLKQRRMLAAGQLLLARESVKIVAGELGFKQTSHFCRQFKFFTMMTPSEFVRMRQQSSPAGAPG